MNHDAAIAERLHDAASRIPVATNPDRVTETGNTRVVRYPPVRRRRLIVGVAVAAAAVMVSIGVTPSTDTLEAGPADGEGPVGDAAPAAPESFAPHVASPPLWFGEPNGGRRTGGLREGRWVSMAIGEAATNGVTDPIVITVFDGSYQPLDDAEPVTIDGIELRSLRFEDWQALATNDTPTVMVSGPADEHVLSTVLDAVEVVDPAGELSVRLRSQPVGYTGIASPRALGPDPETSRTLGNESGDVGINEVSDWTDPLLYAASSGADLAAVDLGGTTGWTGHTTANPYGPLRFLVWSPRPGVIFEITTSDGERSDGDLVELARATSALEIRAWDTVYGG